MAWVYLSSRAVGTRLIPKVETRTIPSIVMIVIPPKIPATSTKAKRLLFAAGYISMGINGSQGPRTNIVKSTHGVILLVPFAV